MDQDIFLNALSAADVKAAYESNADTNAFTDTLLNKLNAIEENAKDDQDADEVPYDNTTSEFTATDVQAAIDELNSNTAQSITNIGNVFSGVSERIDEFEEDTENRLDIIEGDDQTAGSIAKALKDAQDYADTVAASQDEAVEITYDSSQTSLNSTDVQGAIDELESRIEIVQGDDQTAGSIAEALKDAKDYTDGEIGNVEGRLDTIEGTGSGSIIQALEDAKDYTDSQVALYDEAVEITYDNTTSNLTAVDVQEAIDEVVGELTSHIDDTTIHYTQAEISITESQISDFGTYEPADANILKGGDIGVTVEGFDATILKSADIGVTVQAYDADTVVDANYETFDPSGTYDNLRAKGTTAEDVGLENVTNESKATMFTDPTFTGVVTLSGETKKLTGLPEPADASDATTKAYVDALAQGIKARTSAFVFVDFDLDATYDSQPTLHELTANNNEVFPTVDGIDDTFLNVVGARILVAGQTNAEENGLYVVKTAGVDGVSPWVIRRCTLCDISERIPGSYIFITKGTDYLNTGWILNVDNPVTFVLGTDNIDAVQFSGAGIFTAGDGLDLTSNEFSLSGDSFDEDGTFASLRAQGTTKEDVGLTNVTDNEQVKAAASSTDGHIPKWSGTDGDAIVDGYGVQTTLSDTTTDLVRADAIVAALLEKADKLANIMEKTAGFTIDTFEADKVIVINNGASNITITVPTNAANPLPIGTQIAFIRNGSGTVTFTSSATLLSDASKKKIKAQYTSAALVKIDTDTWQLVGNLAA